MLKIIRKHNAKALHHMKSN